MNFTNNFRKYLSMFLILLTSDTLMHLLHMVLLKLYISSVLFHYLSSHINNAESRHFGCPSSFSNSVSRQVQSSCFFRTQLSYCPQFLPTSWYFITLVIKSKSYLLPVWWYFTCKMFFFLTQNRVYLHEWVAIISSAYCAALESPLSPSVSAHLLCQAIWFPPFSLVILPFIYLFVLSALSCLAVQYEWWKSSYTS